jgi:hypothetical protein
VAYNDFLPRNHLCLASFSGRVNGQRSGHCHSQGVDGWADISCLALFVEHACQMVFQEKFEFDENENIKLNQAKKMNQCVLAGERTFEGCRIGWWSRHKTSTVDLFKAQTDATDRAKASAPVFD